MRIIRLSIITLLAIFIGLATYTIINSEKEIAIVTGTVYPQDFKPISSFRLVDHNDKAFTKDSFAGKWTLLFFGFTNCPDVCPTTLATLQQIEKHLAKKIEKHQINYVFVSVDAKRDTPEKLKAYVEYFSPQFLGLSGDDSELKKLSSSLAAFYIAPKDSNEENYLVEHSASIYLINENAQPLALFSYPHNADNIAADITLLDQAL